MEKKKHYSTFMIMHKRVLRGFCHWKAIDETKKLLEEIQDHKIITGSNGIGKKQRSPNLVSATPQELREMRKISNEDKLITLPVSKMVELMSRKRY